MAKFRYTQTVLGDCGHVCDAWPQVAKLGVHGPMYVCEICTKEKYGVEPFQDGLMVLVRRVRRNTDDPTLDMDDFGVDGVVKGLERRLRKVRKAAPKKPKEYKPVRKDGLW